MQKILEVFAQFKPTLQNKNIVKFAEPITTEDLNVLVNTKLIYKQDEDWHCGNTKNAHYAEIKINQLGEEEWYWLFIDTETSELQFGTY